MGRIMLLTTGVGLLVTGGSALLDASPSSRKSQRAGTVEGVVRVQSVDAESPPMLSPYSRRRYRPPSTSARDRITPENVVIYVPVTGDPDPSGGNASPAAARAVGSGSTGGDQATGRRATAVITQRDRTIIPHVTTVLVGTRIDFPNEDDVFHNLFSLSDPGPFNLGRYPPGESRSVTFDRPGVIRMFCDIHSEMTAVIRVMDTPHFTRPASDGTFRLTGLPEGRQTVVAWHDQLGADTVEVDVSATAGASVDLRLPR